jgi:hypothetical protein
MRYAKIDAFEQLGEEVGRGIPPGPLQIQACGHDAGLFVLAKHRQ